MGITVIDQQLKKIKKMISKKKSQNGGVAEISLVMLKGNILILYLYI